MPAKHTLHVALTEPLLRFVQDRIDTGQYATASEVVRAALRLMNEREGRRLTKTVAQNSPEHSNAV